MANANIARGLTPVRHINGAPYSGSGRMYYVPASDGTALYIGDPVITVTGSADAAGIPTVTRAAAGGGTYITGVVTGVISGGDPLSNSDDRLEYILSRLRAMSEMEAPRDARDFATARPMPLLPPVMMA